METPFTYIISSKSSYVRDASCQCGRVDKFFGKWFTMFTWFLKSATPPPFVHPQNEAIILKEQTTLLVP